MQYARIIVLSLAAAVGSLFLGGCSQHIKAVAPVSEIAQASIEKWNAEPRPVESTVLVVVTGEDAADDHLSDLTRGVGDPAEMQKPMHNVTYTLHADRSHGDTVVNIIREAMRVEGIESAESDVRRLTVQVNRFEFDNTTTRQDREIDVEIELFVEDLTTGALLIDPRRIAFRKTVAADMSGEEIQSASGFLQIILAIFGGLVPGGGLVSGAGSMAGSAVQIENEKLAFNAVFNEAFTEIAKQFRIQKDILDALRNPIPSATGETR